MNSTVNNIDDNKDDKQKEYVDFVIKYVMEIAWSLEYNPSTSNEKMVEQVLKFDKIQMIDFSRKLFEAGLNIGYAEHEKKMKRLGVID